MLRPEALRSARRRRLSGGRAARSAMRPGQRSATKLPHLSSQPLSPSSWTSWQRPVPSAVRKGLENPWPVASRAGKRHFLRPLTAKRPRLLRAPAADADLRLRRRGGTRTPNDTYDPLDLLPLSAA